MFFQVGMRLKKKSQEAKVEVRKKSQEEDQVSNANMYDGIIQIKLQLYTKK